MGAYGLDLAKIWDNRQAVLNTVAKTLIPQNVAKFWIIWRRSGCWM